MTSAIVKLLLFVVSVLTLTAQAPANERPLTLATGNSFAPFADQNLPGGGMTSELLNGIFSSAGYTFDIVFWPWKRGYREALSVRVDGIFPYYETDQRKQEFLFSKPLFATTAGLYVLKDLKATPTMEEDLAGLRFCRAAGYSIPEELQGLVAANRIAVVETPKAENSLRMLIRGRCDFVVWNNVISIEIFNSLADSRSKVRRLPIEWPPSTMHFLVAKTHPQAERLIETVNAGLDRLKASGAYDSLVERHLNPQ